MFNTTIECDQYEEFNMLDLYTLWLYAMISVCVITFIVLIIILNMPVSNDYLGAIDENKNLDVELYVRNHRQFIRAQKLCALLPPDFPSSPENVVLPLRPGDNENQVPVY